MKAYIVDIVLKILSSLVVIFFTAGKHFAQIHISVHGLFETHPTSLYLCIRRLLFVKATSKEVVLCEIIPCVCSGKQCGNKENGP